MRIPRSPGGEESQARLLATQIGLASAGGVATSTEQGPASSAADASPPSSSARSAHSGVLGVGSRGAAAGDQSGLAERTRRFQQNLERLQESQHSPQHHHQEQQQQQQQQQQQSVSIRESTLRAVMAAELRLFDAALEEHLGLRIHEVEGDGNCFFRAVSLQVFGDEDMHDQVRLQIMNFIDLQRDHFSQYVAGDFGEYVLRKRRNRVFANNLEIQAAGELYNRPVEIYTFDSRLISSGVNDKAEVEVHRSLNPAQIRAGLRMVNLFHQDYSDDIAVSGAASPSEGGGQAPLNSSMGEAMPPLRFSYHYGNHYNAIIDPEAPTAGVGLGLPNLEPNERARVEQAVVESESQVIDAALFSGVTHESDVAATQDDIETAILEASRREFDEAQILQMTATQPSSAILTGDDDDDAEAQILATILAESERQYLNDLSSGN